MKVSTIKNKLFAVLAVLLCVLLTIPMFGCQQKTTASFTLVVGFDESYPPYGFVGDNGQYTGFDIDMAKAVCEKLGWGLELKAIDWDAKDALLEQGQINCIWNGFTKEGREGKYYLSDPYMTNKQVVVVKEGSNIKSLADLQGKVVITQADSAALEVLQGDKKSVADTFSRLDTIGDYNNAFMQLDSGAVDAVACDLSIAQYQISANSGKYEGIEEALSSENYVVAFPRNTEGATRANYVTQIMMELDSAGKVKEICDKYESYGISYDNWLLRATQSNTADPSSTSN